MKRIKDIIIGFILGIIVLGGLSAYAVEAVIQSKEVSYDNTKSNGNYTDVQGSIDELYERSGIMKKKWVDPILNGADPVFDNEKQLIPVTIADDGTVHYANLYTKWYEYETKRWANAVILTDDGKKKNYKTGDKIDEEYIESYFVWIPRYKYKIWDLGIYANFYKLSQLQDSADTADNPTALRNIVGKTRLIDIIFQNKNDKTTDKDGECAPDPTSGGGDNCHVGDYMTHPAFTLGSEELNGIWVGKFEISGTINNITIKPNNHSVLNETVGAFWKVSYNYKRGLDSHMIKNTEWGAIAYLSHSTFGIGREVNINNNLEFKTGYSATTSTNQNSNEGENGNTEDKTQPWNTPTGYLASTTGNITGVYDMSGGAYEYMAAYIDGNSGYSKLTSELTDNNYSKYFDKYSNTSTITSYNLRILGDATGEMGSFYNYYDKNKYAYTHNSWYTDVSDFVDLANPWFDRGGYHNNGNSAGQFNFVRNTGDARDYIGSRLVLSPTLT